MEKTTLCRIVAGDLSHDSGLLSYPTVEQKKSKNPDWLVIKNQIGYLPQELPPIVGTVRENLHFEATLHGIYHEENEQQVNFILQRLELAEYEYATWDKLSGGYKLRFALALLLVWRPKLLVLDEPLANLDVNAQLNLLADLKDLASSLRYPISILLTSQHLHEVESISDYIIHLRDGKEIYYGKTDAIGEGRKENTYEFECDVQQIELEKRLKGLNYLKLSYNGLHYVITTPIQVSNQDVLSSLIDQDVNIQYFRDISHSSKSEMIKS